MAYEHKPGTGSMFQNTNKKSESAPDYKGEINLNGKVIKLAGWITQSKNGQQYLKLKEDTFVPTQTAAPAAAEPDLPF